MPSRKKVADLKEHAVVDWLERVGLKERRSQNFVRCQRIHKILMHLKGFVLADSYILTVPTDLWVMCYRHDVNTRGMNTTTVAEGFHSSAKGTMRVNGWE